MVASIGVVASASQGVSYYERDGYYASDDRLHREASAWAGKGAAALALSGRSTRFRVSLAGSSIFCLPGLRIPDALDAGRSAERSSGAAQRRRRSVADTEKRRKARLRSAVTWLTVTWAPRGPMTAARFRPNIRITAEVQIGDNG